MKFEHRFQVALPVADAWRTLLDIERIAPCVPGAKLERIDGDTCHGSVKVKLGPITAQYKGTVTFTEKSEADRRLVAQAKGRDIHGQGNANSTITMQLEAVDSGTEVTLDTDLQISGKVAQLGRGVMQEVSARIIDQFAAALARDVGAATPAPEATQHASVAAPIAAPIAAPLVEPAQQSASQPPATAQPEPEAIDLLQVAGASLAKRAALIAAIVALVALAIFLL